MFVPEVVILKGMVEESNFRIFSHLLSAINWMAWFRKPVVSISITYLKSNFSPFHWKPMKMSQNGSGKPRRKAGWCELPASSTAHSVPHTPHKTPLKAQTCSFCTIFVFLTILVDFKRIDEILEDLDISKRWLSQQITTGKAPWLQAVDSAVDFAADFAADFSADF